MRPTRELRNRPILSLGLGGAIGGASSGDDPFDQYVLTTEGGRDAVSDHGDLGSTENVDPTNGNVHTGTLNADCTITLLTPDTTRLGAVSTIELYLTEDGTGGWDPTFAASGGTIVWPGGSPPAHDTTADTLTRYVFETLDDGVTWYGNVVGGSGGGATALDDLTDVTITSPQEDDTLRFVGSVWVNDNRRWEAVTDGEDVFVWESDDLVHEWKEY